MNRKIKKKKKKKKKEREKRFILSQAIMNYINKEFINTNNKKIK